MMIQNTLDGASTLCAGSDQARQLSKHAQRVHPQDSLSSQPSIRDTAPRTGLGSLIEADLTDLTQPASWYPAARLLQRNITAHVGPPNSGDLQNTCFTWTHSQHGCVIVLVHRLWPGCCSESEEGMDTLGAIACHYAAHKGACPGAAHVPRCCALWSSILYIIPTEHKADTRLDAQWHMSNRHFGSASYGQGLRPLWLQAKPATAKF